MKTFFASRMPGRQACIGIQRTHGQPLMFLIWQSLFLLSYESYQLLYHSKNAAAREEANDVFCRFPERAAARSCRMVAVSAGMPDSPKNEEPEQPGQHEAVDGKMAQPNALDMLQKGDDNDIRNDKGNDKAKSEKSNNIQGEHAVAVD